MDLGASQGEVHGASSFKSMQPYLRACNLMNVHARSWTYLKAIIEMGGSSCNCMQSMQAY